MKYLLRPLLPYVDGYDVFDDEVLPLKSRAILDLEEPGMWFSDSRKTCYWFHGECDFSIFRKKGKYWICWRSGSEQLWEICYLHIIDSFLPSTP